MHLKILAADEKGIAVEAEEITDEPVRLRTGQEEIAMTAGGFEHDTRHPDAVALLI